MTKRTTGTTIAARAPVDNGALTKSREKEGGKGCI